jgi:peroxiredoxin
MCSTMQSEGRYKMQIGDPAPDFSLKGVDGKMHTLSKFAAKILVVFFSCNHCPYVLGCEKKISQLVDKFAGDVEFIAINSNDAVQYPDDSYDNMVKHAEEAELIWAYLYDETQAVAKEYGGVCTPHFFVFDQERKLAYQGRLDEMGRDGEPGQKHELRDALEALRDEKDVPEPVTCALGCSIKWKQ